MSSGNLNGLQKHNKPELRANVWMEHNLKWYCDSTLVGCLFNGKSTFYKASTVSKSINFGKPIVTDRLDGGQVCVPGELTGLKQSNMPVLREYGFVQLNPQKLCNRSHVISHWMCNVLLTDPRTIIILIIFGQQTFHSDLRLRRRKVWVRATRRDCWSTTCQNMWEKICMEHNLEKYCDSYWSSLSLQWQIYFFKASTISESINLDSRPWMIA